MPLPVPKEIKASDTPMAVEDLDFTEVQVLQVIWRTRLRRIKKAKRAYKASNPLVRQLVTDLDKLKRHEQKLLQDMVKTA